MKEVDTKGWLVWDVETNMLPESQVRGSFYKRAFKMICLVTQDISTGEIKRFVRGQEEEMFDHLMASPRWVGHNLRSFDAPALGNIYPNMNAALRGHPMIDTLVASRDMYDNGMLSRYDAKKGLPQTKALHSLKSWGYRLGDQKVEAFLDTNWETQPWTEELEEYCVQDVHVNLLVFKKIMKDKGFILK
tara:strand:- start:279 stop:845 length:567 start_codon:yes stop_codon:yes gene_type:complete